MMNFCLCRFLEYGEYKDNLYGTSLESIHKVLAQNKVCLMDVQPEVCDCTGAICLVYLMTIFNLILSTLTLFNFTSSLRR